MLYISPINSAYFFPYLKVYLVIWFKLMLLFTFVYLAPLNKIQLTNCFMFHVYHCHLYKGEISLIICAAR